MSRRNGREPRFDLDYEYGRQGELWVSSLRDAISSERVEVKTDSVIAETKNLYVEWACLRQGEWKPSGIRTTEAEVWLFVVEPTKVGIVIETDFLIRAARRAWRNPRNHRECSDGSHPTKGVLVPIPHLFSEVLQLRMSGDAA